MHRPSERSGEDVDIILTRLRELKAFHRFPPPLLLQICACAFYECLEKGITCMYTHTHTHTDTNVMVEVLLATHWLSVEESSIIIALSSLYDSRAAEKPFDVCGVVNWSARYKREKSSRSWYVRSWECECHFCLINSWQDDMKEYLQNKITFLFNLL